MKNKILFGLDCLKEVGQAFVRPLIEEVTLSTKQCISDYKKFKEEKLHDDNNTN